jgi:hypothetical protein
MQALYLSVVAGRARCGYGCHCVAYGAIKAPLLVAFATSLVSTFNHTLSPTAINSALALPGAAFHVPRPFFNVTAYR